MLVRRKDSRKLYAMKALRVDSAVPKSQVTTHQKPSSYPSSYPQLASLQLVC